MTITRIGRSVSKLSLVEEGEDFLKAFTIERPLETKSFEDIKRQGSSLFILKSKKETGLKFRGQMYHDKISGQIYFLGSPLIKSFDDLKGVDLSLNDFALHDNINQFLFTTQMLTSSLNDLKDLSERLEESNLILKQKNIELEDFAYVLSHDLKSPIRGIVSLAEFMQEDIANNKFDEIPFYSETIMGRLYRMNNLIEGILDFSKIGVIKLKKEEIDLNELVNHIFEDTIIEDHIECKIKASLPTVHNVRVLFIQLFSNLIGNAAKYNDKARGLISVGFKDLGDSYEFSIEDNGPGIAESYHEKIFQLFQTLNSGYQVESTGVGLAIVKKIVTFLKGTIRVESKIDEGSTFYVTIPKD